MKRKIKENTGFFFRNYFYYTLFMLVWWVVVSFLTEAVLGLRTLGLKDGIWVIIKNFPITALFSLALAALYSIGEEKLFPVKTGENGIYRQNAVWYYLWNYLFEMLNLITIYVWISQRYHIFRVTTVIIIALECFGAITTIFTLGSLRKRMRAWINDASRQNKKVCTYLLRQDFAAVRISLVAEMLGILLKHNYDIGKFLKRNYDTTIITYFGVQDILEKSNSATVCKHTLDMFWESKDMLICPHWLYRDFFPEEESRRSKLILFADDVLIDRAETASVIDESFAAGNDVAIYFHEDSLNQYEKITSRPVHKFYEKKAEMNKAADFMAVGTEWVKIPYFDRGMFIHAYPKSLPAIMKYEYIDGEILLINKIKDPTECFYRLLKLVEYAWHYRALAIISHNPDNYNDLFAKDSFQSSLGLWEKYQENENYKYTDAETVRAYRLVSDLLNGKSCGKKIIYYPELCQVITQLRNRYVGHGTMAFSVSQELLDAVKQLTAVVLGAFYKQEIFLLEETDKSKEQVPLAYYNTENGRSLCLLAGYIGQGHKISEYLDYKFATFRSNDRVEYRLDYKGGI
ncbi:MAG: hypothetical protein NC313_02350 [Butyrivibrio sp.]|nr:hypothetical protein [Butyrivibrio sp.]